MTTATVETLTAEVRVLMVGNRQVTLSVYRQLDKVDSMEIVPFGRVNDGKDSGTWVVGKDAESGALVRAQYIDNPGLYIRKEEAGIRYPWATVERRRDAHDSHIIECIYDRYIQRGYAKIWSDGDLSVHLEIDRFDWIMREDSWRYMNPERRPAIEQWAAQRLMEYKPRHEQARRCANLPLIVLAGLR
jgi:hypothetical protein